MDISTTSILAVYRDHEHFLALYCYGVPVIYNAISYSHELVARYSDEVSRRRMFKSSYYPKLTVGWVVGAFFKTFLPIVNVISMVGRLPWMFELFGRVLSWISEVLDIPLVPKRHVDDEV